MNLMDKLRMAGNLEFDENRFKLADMDNYGCRVSSTSTSPQKRPKEENHKDLQRKSKIKEKPMSHFILNLVVLRDWSLSLSTVHFFKAFTTDFKKIIFLDQ